MDAIRRSLRLLKIEAILTGTLIAMPVMVPFYHSIGMDQGQIGLSQAIFTVALLLVNVPTGWIADRFSRKLCNALGDLGGALSLLYYAQADSFAEVIVAEVALGISLAFSQGADSALLRAYTQFLDGSGKLFRKANASIASWQPIAQIIALMIGGVVGAFSPRLAIAISAAPYIIGCVLSLFMKEEGVRLVSVHRNPLRDMVRVTKESIGTDPYLRWLIAAFSVGREATHVLIWTLTPLLLLAGVPPIIVGAGWVINSLMVAVGAKLAHRFAEPLAAWQRFVIPMCLVVLGLSVISIHLSLATVWLYTLIGIAQGWTSATLLPMVQAEAPESQQASIVSITRSAAQLLYIPLVWFVGYAGNFDIRYSMIATIVVFLPMIVVTTWRLVVLERR